MVLVFFFLFNLFSKSFPLLLIYLPHLLMHLPWCLFFLVSLSLFVSQDFRYKPLIFLEKIVPLRTCMLDPRFAAFLITIFHDVFHQRILHFLPQIWPSYELFPFRFFIFVYLLFCELSIFGKLLYVYLVSLIPSIWTEIDRREWAQRGTWYNSISLLLCAHHSFCRFSCARKFSKSTKLLHEPKPNHIIFSLSLSLSHFDGGMRNVSYWNRLHDYIFHYYSIVKKRYIWL